MTKSVAPDTLAQAPPVHSWLLWQLVDSAFPIGSFAHSGGTESVYQHGRLTSADDLLAFTRATLEQSLHASVPFLLAAYDQTTPLDELHDLLDSMLVNHVANRASRAQAHALLATTEKVFPLPILTSYRRTILASNSPIHLPIILGFLVGHLAIPRTDALRLHFFLTTRTILSAAVRLGAVGPLQAQQLQTTLAPTLDALTAQAHSLTLADACQTSPLLDLLQGTQDRLYSRLFQS